jgi:hypothetical protein
MGLCGGSYTEAECIRTPPFTVYPSYFSLKKGESVELTIEFVPLTLGNLTADFYMVCDNRQVRSFSLRACSRQIDISVVEINNTRYDRKITDLASDLYFSGVTVQTEKTQQLVLCNDTGIPIEFEWVWIQSCVGTEHTQAEARKVLRCIMFNNNFHLSPFSCLLSYLLHLIFFCFMSFICYHRIFSLPFFFFFYSYIYFLYKYFCFAFISVQSTSFHFNLFFIVYIYRFHCSQLLHVLYSVPYFPP